MHDTHQIPQPQLLDLPKFSDCRGSLSFIEERLHIPFRISRTYWIGDVPGGAVRGGHAYRRNQEFLVALSGSLDVVLNDGVQSTRWHLNRSYYGLYVPCCHWRELENFSTNAVVLVLASEPYDEADYIRDYEQFRRQHQ